MFPAPVAIAWKSRSRITANLLCVPGAKKPGARLALKKSAGCPIGCTVATKLNSETANDFLPSRPAKVNGSTARFVYLPEHVGFEGFFQSKDRSMLTADEFFPTPPTCGR
jgi:hypothetical protein